MSPRRNRTAVLATSAVVAIGVFAAAAPASAATRPIVIKPWPYQTSPWTFNPSTWVTQKFVFNKAIVRLIPISDTVTRIKKVYPRAVNLSRIFNPDLRTWAEPVGNQGGIGSCVSWAVGYGMAGWWANKRSKMTAADWFNPMSVYSVTRSGGPEPPGGSLPADAMTRIRDTGITKAADYSVNEFDYAHTPTTDEVNAGKPFKFSSFRTLFNDTIAGDAGISMIKKELFSGRPVEVSMKVYSDFMDTSKVNNTNTYSIASGATYQGKHAVLALGYNSSGLLIQNSWGTGWGASGFKRLSWAFVKDNVYRAYVADGMVS